ncbi:hypothetical protein [Mesorhizobium sp.]|uniref:hypothetical protein n=1 Tax=Mesorhizobium sp. TaxID=1871066 RepID=UPI0025BA269A|nr:hypothetical protein [Mesorhizobium sp.]
MTTAFGFWNWLAMPGQLFVGQPSPEEAASESNAVELCVQPRRGPRILLTTF